MFGAWVAVIPCPKLAFSNRERVFGMNGERRNFPPPGPSRRSVSVLIWATLLLLVLNVAHQAGLG